MWLNFHTSMCSSVQSRLRGQLQQAVNAVQDGMVSTVSALTNSWREEGKGADPAAIAAALVALLLGYLDLALPQVPEGYFEGHGGAEEDMQVCQACMKTPNPLQLLGRLHPAD